MKVHKTENYKMFKYYPENRDIEMSHVANLKKSVQGKNLLAYHPILVDKDMFVLDGQHRLEVAKLLKRPIYYSIVKDSTLDDLWIINANQKNWSSENFLNFYVRRGKADYVVLKDFVEEYGLSVYQSAHICAIGSREGYMRNLSRNFKEGLFKINDINLARRVGSKILELREYTEEGAWKNRAFAFAVYRLIDKPELEVILSKLKSFRRSAKIQRQASVMNYLRNFEYILNLGKQKEENYIRLI